MIVIYVVIYVVIILHRRCLGNIRCNMTVTFCFGMFIVYSQENTYHVILCPKICQTKFRKGICPPKFRIEYDKRYIMYILDRIYLLSYSCRNLSGGSNSVRNFSGKFGHNMTWQIFYHGIYIGIFYHGNKSRHIPWQKIPMYIPWQNMPWHIMCKNVPF